MQGGLFPKRMVAMRYPWTSTDLVLRPAARVAASGKRCGGRGRRMEEGGFPRRLQCACACERHASAHVPAPSPRCTR
eukprot:6231219-Pyramimonas_sp.AAC.1